ncbi:MAG: STAS/SEC14 domain-containing protein [Pseudomonadota bacterium]
MPLTIRESGDEGWAEITVSGRVVQQDIRTILPLVRRAVDRHGTLRIVEVIAGFEGYDFGSLWPLFEDDTGHLAQITHAAVVCDFGWMGPISRAAALVTPVMFRSFLTHDRDGARDWIAYPGIATQSAPQPGAPRLVAG